MNAQSNRISHIKVKVWNIVKKIKEERKNNKGEFDLGNYEIITSGNYNKRSCIKIPIMHPEFSKLRLLIDLITCLLLATDLLISPYEYLVNIKSIFGKQLKDKKREILFDCLFFFDILSNFFTAYFQNKLLIKEFNLIFFNYIKFQFIFDLIYVTPFWLLEPYLIYLD